MAYHEYNFDGLVGPTHNYAGLGTGNLASMASKHHVSSPKAAALEGLAKMKLLAEMGVPQAILPPQRRPHVGYLRARYGARRATGRGGAETRAQTAGMTEESGTGLPSADPWHGAPIDWITDRPKIDEVAALLRAAAENGEEGRRDLAIASSASSMWAANAATVSPSPDTADGRLHITPANLVSQPHRALEAAERWRVLEYAFAEPTRFAIHPPLAPRDADEGAANHGRLCVSHGGRGIELFVFGRPSGSYRKHGGFLPRQTFSASLQVRRRHGLIDGRRRDGGGGNVISVRMIVQSPDAIAAGVFHNDVINVVNETVVLLHERAWRPSRVPSDLIAWINEATRTFCGFEPTYIKFADAELPLADAVRSYLFNSQLVTLPSGEMALIYPAECDEVPTAKAAIDRILREDNPVARAVRVDVRQSMKNGGGPACLRLRVVLSDEERAAVRGNVFWSPQIHETLIAWVNRHYRDTLTPQDLADVRLYEESMAALDELGEILELPL